VSAMQRRKGAQGEREVSAELRRLGFTDCRRGRQFSGLEGRDVVGIEGLHLETKRTETLSLYAAMDQAVRDAATGDVPVVLHRRSRRPWLAVVHLDHAVSFSVRLLRALGYHVVPPGDAEAWGEAFEAMRERDPREIQ
jgi:Holliday junction resolvase